MQSGNILSQVLLTDENLRGAPQERRLCSVSDADLVRLCRGKDREAQDALMELTRRFQAPLFRFLLRLMGSKEDAEEAALEVFVRVWQHSGNFRHQASVSTWLYRIAANIARDHHSRRLVRPQSQSWDTCSPSQLTSSNAETEAINRLHQGERTRILLQALETLSPDDRLVLVLYYLEQQEYAEMQAVTGWIYPVLKTRLVRARIRLRARLKDLGFEEAL
jgi:RNA polymerase sigma-70 factor (ECF subfamily)